jgi:hypothetical protein
MAGEGGLSSLAAGPVLDEWRRIAADLLGPPSLI